MLYGGRNPFRTGRCSPDDVNHNMQMLSQLHNDLGNPVPGGVPSTHQVGGFLPFRTTDIFVLGGTVAEILDGNGDSTGDTIIVIDPTGNLSGSPVGTAGYAMPLPDGTAQVIAGGEPGTIEAGGGGATVQMDAEGDPEYLEAHFITGDPVTVSPPVGQAPDFNSSLHNIGYVGTDTNNRFQIYTDKPTTTLGDTFENGASYDSGPGYDSSTQELVSYDGSQWYMPRSRFDSIDSKVKVVADANEASDVLYNQFTPGALTITDTAHDPGEGGVEYNPDLYDFVYWDVRKKNAEPANKSMMGLVPARGHIRMGVTTTSISADGETAATGDTVNGIAPAIVTVHIYELGDNNKWVKVAPVDEVIAKVWAFGEKDAGYPVIIARDRSSVDLGGQDNWWVIWFPCDKVPVPG